MLRVQIKCEGLFASIIAALKESGYRIVIKNHEGNCLYINTGEVRHAFWHHWSHDFPIIEINETNQQWLINCITC